MPMLHSSPHRPVIQIAGVLGLTLLSACPLLPQGDTATTTDASETGTGTTTGSTSAPVDPTGSINTVTTAGDTTGTTAVTTTGDTTDPGTTTTTTTTGDTTGDTTGGTDPGKMSEWGHACMNDDDCMAIVGDKGVCQTDVLGTYELPGGYCTKGCDLPEMTMYVEDHPTCGPGVTCIGVKGYFETCTVECTDDSECPREGYECRILPVIGVPGDPMFCLMTDDHML